MTPEQLPAPHRILAAPRSASRSSGGETSEPALLNLREPLAALGRHYRLVVGITATVAGIVAYQAYRAVSFYRAVAVIRLSDPRRALTSGVAEGPTPAFGAGSVDPLLSQVELLESRSVAGVVVDSMPILRVVTRNFDTRLVQDVHFTSNTHADSLQLTFRADSVAIGGRTGTARAPYGAPVEVDGIRLSVGAKPEGDRGTLFVTSRDAAIGRLIGSLRVVPRAHTDVVDVAYLATDPERAQAVVNNVVQVFREVNAEEARRQSRLRREFLETQVKVNDSLLADARSGLTAFRRRAGRAASSQPSGAAQAGIDQLQVQREQVDADRRMYRGILTSLDTASSRGKLEALRAAASTPGIAANAVVAPIFTQLAHYEGARDSLAARSSAHPDLPRLDQLIATTQGKLLGTVQSVVQGLIASLDMRIATLDEARAHRAANVEQLSATDAEEARFEERVENARKIADELRIEYQKARIAEAVEVGQVEIVDLAVVPSVPLGIGFFEKLALGLLLGLVLGGGSAFLTEHLRSSIGRPKEIEELGVPVLSAVPHCKEGRNGARADQIGPAIEAFRGLRLNLVHAHGAAGPVAFALSSPGSREGKSFIAANLALAFAHANYQTVLIDGDTRRGTLHRALNAARKPGVTDFLTGGVSQSEVVQVTKYRSLHFIGCGIRRPDSPELLNSPRMSELLAYLRANFAVIIVDTPPLGAGVDAFALATITGNLLLVLRSGTTNRELVGAKLDLLHRLPVRVLGAVLNDVRQGPDYRGYSYYLAGYEATEEVVREHRTLLRGRS